MPPQRLGILTYFCVSALLVAWCTQRDFARQGDGWEYLAGLEALSRHATPDVRPDDFAALFSGIDAWRGGGTGDVPPAREVFAAELEHSFVTARDGRSYPLHFWMYSLFAVPAKLLLRLSGGREFNALIVTNAWMFCGALALVLAAGSGSARRRVAFALLAAVTPAVWYLTFTGVEIFCWALVVAALVALERGHYPASALAAALAATQNPPLLLLAGVPVLVAAARRQRRAAPAAALAASAGLWPFAFSWWHFGVPTTIAPYLDPGLISVGRTQSLLFDLNAGLLAHAPMLLVAVPWAAWRLRRHLSATLIALVVIGSLLLVQTQINWNSDGRGLRRYLVWVLPLLAWLVVQAWSGRARTRWVTAAVLSSVLLLVMDPPSQHSYLEHGALARWVLREAPALYNPEFEEFTERSSHGESPLWSSGGIQRYGWMAELPVAHGRPTGEVTKLLVNRGTANQLTRRFRVEPLYLPELQRRAMASVTPVYVEPPPGMVWAAPGSIDGVYEPYLGPRPAPPEPARTTAAP